MNTSEAETFTKNGDAAVESALRIALPNKGSLADRSQHILLEAGYVQRANPRDLMVFDAEHNVQFFYLRPKDIAVYVGSGRIHLGVTGRDLLLDSKAPAEECLPLEFGHTTFRYAAPLGTVSSPADLAGLRVATSYPGLVERDLAQRGITADLVTLDGAVENAVRLGVADAVADVVETGRTLREAGLTLVGEPILESEAVLIRQTQAAAHPAERQLIRRIQGVLVAASYAMVDYDIEIEKLERAVAITPGMESPTVAPLHHQGWVAVRALVLKASANSIMDELADLGARAVLLTDIRICRI